MIQRALALFLCLTVLWSGSAVSGQPLAGLLGPLGRTGQTTAAPAHDQVAGLAVAGQNMAQPTDEALARALLSPLAQPLSPLNEPEALQGDDLATPQHSEPLPDVVGLLELPAERRGGFWQSPRPQSRADLLPHGPHLEGLRRPPRLGAVGA